MPTPDLAVYDNAEAGTENLPYGSGFAVRPVIQNAALMPADPSKGYATPYYAAYTNDGDFAGAVMVAPGQKVRLFDKMTGDVVFEGVGPEGAKTATTVANSISREKGRTAAWAIQKPTDAGGWVSMAEERWDPKKQSFLGKVADIALPIIGAILAPGVGLAWAAAGSALGSAASSTLQGRSVEETLKRAALSAGLTAVGGYTVGKLGQVLANAENPVAQALYTGYRTIVNPISAGVRGLEGASADVFDQFGNLIVRGGVDKAAGAVFSAGLPGTLTNLVPTGGPATDVSGVEVTGGGADTLAGGTLTNLVPTGGPATDVSGVEVTGGGADTLAGGTLTNLVPTGGPATDVSGVEVTGGGADTLAGGTLTNLVPTGGPATDVSGVEVTGGGADTLAGGTLTNLVPTDGPVTDVSGVKVTGGADTQVGGVLGTLGSDVVLSNDTIPGNVDGLDTSGPDYEEKSFTDKLVDWVKANPLEAAKIGLKLVGGVVTAIGATSGGSGGGGSAATPDQLRSQLSPVFRAQLPTPSGIFANLGARDVSMTPEQWKTYGQRPEMPFFNYAPQRPSGIIDTSNPVVDYFPAGEAEPNAPLGTAGQSTSAGPTFTGAIDPYSSDDFVPRSPASNTPFRDILPKLDMAVRATPLPKPEEAGGFARGGFAVHGMGTGRSDSIPARLSDGEYVIDAETVALLGDGSSKAGADRLDKFRVNIRKHKGKKLAKGRFSVNAKAPEAYLTGGRV